MTEKRIIVMTTMIYNFLRTARCRYNAVIFYSKIPTINIPEFAGVSDIRYLSGTLHLYLINSSHKSHNISNKYPKVHHFETEIYTHVHISYTKWCNVGYGTGWMWDLCNRSISCFVRTCCNGRYLLLNRMYITMTARLEDFIEPCLVSYEFIHQN